jgi:hypothetical protein
LLSIRDGVLKIGGWLPATRNQNERVRTNFFSSCV